MELARLLWDGKALGEKWDSDSWDTASGEAHMRLRTQNLQTPWSPSDVHE